MMRSVFIDTSTWISYSLSNQPRHSTIRKLMKQLLKDGITIYTSNDVIDETVTRLVYHTNPQIIDKFINFIEESTKTHSIIQLWIDEQIQLEAYGLVKKFYEHKLSLTDATTIALIKKFNIDSVISLDSDFVKVGISTLP